MSYFIKIILFLTLMLKVNLVHGNDSKAGLPQLDLSTYPSLIFWAIISLVLGYILMRYLVTPNIKSILNLRETNIQNDLVKAKSSNQEAEKIKLTILKTQEDIRLQSKIIIDKALSESKNNIEKADNEISKKMNRKILETEKKLIDLQNNVINEIVDNADEITARVINKFSTITHDKASIKQAVKIASKNMLTEN